MPLDRSFFFSQQPFNQNCWKFQKILFVPWLRINNLPLLPIKHALDHRGNNTTFSHQRPFVHPFTVGFRQQERLVEFWQIIAIEISVVISLRIFFSLRPSFLPVHPIDWDSTDLDLFSPSDGFFGVFLP